MPDESFTVQYILQCLLHQNLPEHDDIWQPFWVVAAIPMLRLFVRRPERFHIVFSYFDGYGCVSLHLNLVCVHTMINAIHACTASQCNAEHYCWSAVRQHHDTNGQLADNCMMAAQLHTCIYSLSYYFPWRMQLQASKWDESLCTRRPISPFDSYSKHTAKGWQSFVSLVMTGTF